jgi:hypothetical protein
MTVDFASPRSSLIASGTQTKFTFTWPVLEEPDLLVYLNDVLQVEYSDYILEPDFEDGGDVIFTLAPLSGVVVGLVRKTSITQQLDYTATAFPSQTHEVQLDKIIMILQELLIGRISGDITFDLTAEQQATLVNVLNSGGTDAVIPAWVDATLAGVFHGEITEVAPADGSASAKPDGYMYVEVVI